MRHRASPSPAPDSPTAREANRKLNEDTRPRAGCRKNDKPSLSSKVERDVLRLYAHGSSTDEIAPECQRAASSPTSTGHAASSMPPTARRPSPYAPDTILL